MLSLLLLIAGVTKVPVAVSYFDDASGDPALAGLQKGLASMLITDLSASGDLEVLERARLEDVLSEVKLQQSAWVDPKSAVKLGRGIGASYVIVGSFAVQKSSIRIDARAIDVETGKVAFSTQATGPRDDFFAVERKLASSILENLGAGLSLIQKKRIGAGSTKDVRALLAFSQGLEAQDAGDGAKAKQRMKEALSIDPSFARVQERLDALEATVAALATSGGRILKPKTAADFLHNARQDLEDGRRKDALENVEGAAKANGSLVDPWLLASKIDGAEAKSKLANQYLKGQWAALAGAGRSSLEKTQAAIYTFDLLSRGPPATMRRARAALKAIEQIERAQRSGTLTKVLLDQAALLDRVRSKKLDDARVAQVRMGSIPRILDASRRTKPSMFWDLHLVLFEKPQGDVRVTLEKNLNHPHWKEKTMRSTHRLRIVPRDATREEAKAAQQALDSEGGFIYRPVTGGSMGHWAPGGLGKTLVYERGAIECKPHEISVTGVRCEATMFVYKNTFVPGLYRATTVYTDADRQEAKHTVDTWANEFSITEGLGPHARPDETGTFRRVTMFDATYVERHPKVMGWMTKAFETKRRFKPAGAILVQSYFRKRIWREPKEGRSIKFIAFDFDHALRKKDLDNDDHRGWMRYRDRLLEKGYRVRGGFDGARWIPIPKLSPGRHFICMASVRRDGSKTPEAECHAFMVPRR